MVTRGQKHHLNQPARNKENCQNETKKKEQVTIAEVLQRPLEVPAQVRNNPSNSSYAEVISLAKSNEVELFNKGIYTVVVLIGVRSSHMLPLTCVFDNGSGPNIICIDTLKPS